MSAREGLGKKEMILAGWRSEGKISSLDMAGGPESASTVEVLEGAARRWAWPASTPA
jgi:hypothetical protein